MGDFTQTFFVALIGVIISLVAFLVPMTYRFLRDMARELGEWEAYDLRRKNEIGSLIRQVRHYYSLADLVTDLIAVAGAFSVLSIVITMSQILIPQIGPCRNIAFWHVLNHDRLLPCLLFALYFAMWYICCWDLFRYLKTEFSIKKIRYKPLWWFLLYLFLAVLVWSFTALYEFVFTSLPLALMVYVFPVVVFLIIAVIFKGIERWYCSVLCAFISLILMIAVCASVHWILFARSLGDFARYGVITANVGLIVSLFLYWFSLGILFAPNNKLEIIHRALTDKKLRRSQSGP